LWGFRLCKNISESKEEKVYVPHASELRSKCFYFDIKGFCWSICFTLCIVEYPG